MYGADRSSLSIIYFFPSLSLCYIFRRPIFARKLEIKATDKKATYLTAKSSLLSISYIMSVCGKMMNAPRNAKSRACIQCTYIQLLFP